MKILALDTALAACSAAVWADGRTLAAEQVAMQRGQAEAVIPMVERVLRAAGLGYGELDRFAVTVGPGSFTGIRVGLAAARGLALATGKPLIGVTALEALAATAQRSIPILAAIAARRGEIYAQLFDGTDTAPRAMTIAAASALALGSSGVAVGDGAALLALPVGWRVLDVTLPDCTAIATLAAARPVPDRPPGPLYLRAPDATPAKVP